MITWFVVGLAVMAYLWSWRYLTARMVWAMYRGNRQTPDIDDTVFCAIAGAVFALLAPVVIPFLVMKDRYSGERLSHFWWQRALPKPKHHEGNPRA